MRVAFWHCIASAIGTRCVEIISRTGKARVASLLGIFFQVNIYSFTRSLHMGTPREVRCVRDSIISVKNTFNSRNAEFSHSRELRHEHVYVNSARYSSRQSCARVGSGVMGANVKTRVSKVRWLFWRITRRIATSEHGCVQYNVLVVLQIYYVAFREVDQV